MHMPFAFAFSPAADVLSTMALCGQRSRPWDFFSLIVRSQEKAGGRHAPRASGQNVPLLPNERGAAFAAPLSFGRGRRIRTLGTRFWRPLLYQLSYTPKKTLERRVPIYHTESPPVCQAFSPNKNVCSAPGAGILPCVQCASSLWQPVRMARRGICAVQMPLRAEKACLHHTLCHKYSTASKTRPRLPFCRCFLLFCEKMRRKG